MLGANSSWDVGLSHSGEKVDSGMYNSTIRRQHVLKEFVVFFSLRVYFKFFQAGFLCIALAFQELALHFQVHVLFTWYTLCC